MLANYGQFFTIQENDLITYLHTKSIKRKKLGVECNQMMLTTIKCMILYKNPAGLINRFNKEVYHYLFSLDKNNYGTISYTNTNKNCKFCKKTTASFAHIFKYNYNCVNQPLMCVNCYIDCIVFSNNCMKELAMPNIFKLFCLYKRINIFININNDVFNYIFYLSIQ